MENHFRRANSSNEQGVPQRGVHVWLNIAHSFMHQTLHAYPIYSSAKIVLKYRIECLLKIETTLINVITILSTVLKTNNSTAKAQFNIFLTKNNIKW